MPATIVDVNKNILMIGTLSVTGFADGEAFKFAWDGVDWEGASGSHGEVSVVRKHNNIATGTFRVMQGSVLNDILKAVHAATLAVGGGSFAFRFKDGKGTTDISGFQALFEKYPDEAWGDTSMPREYTIKIFNPKTIGGQNVYA